MGLFNIGEVGLGTAWNFALGLPKHDLGWPSLRPLFRDNILYIVVADQIYFETSSFYQNSGSIDLKEI